MCPPPFGEIHFKLVHLKCNKKLIILPAFQLALLEISPVVLASVKWKSQKTFFRQ